MQIQRYGITLKRLSTEHLELLRYWRNKPEIVQNMEYREYITAEMQKKWFQSLHEKRDFYFMIDYQDKLVGLINIKNIDWKDGTGEAGLFVWNEQFLKTHIPVLASLTLLDFFLVELRLQEVTAKVLQSNELAIEYNESLGFEKMTEDHGNFNHYRLSRDRYLTFPRKLKNAVLPLNEDNPSKVEMNERLFDFLFDQRGFQPQQFQVSLS